MIVGRRSYHRTGDGPTLHANMRLLQLKGLVLNWCMSWKLVHVMCLLLHHHQPKRQLVSLAKKTIRGRGASAECAAKDEWAVVEQPIT